MCFGMPKVPLELDLPNPYDVVKLAWSKLILELFGGFHFPIDLWMVWRRFLVFDLVLVGDGLNEL